MNNSTENSGDDITRQGDFEYHSLFITLFFLTPAFIFNILLLVAIIVEKTLPGTIRLILSNIIIASEVVILGIAIILVQNVILSGWKHLSSSLFVCRFTYVTLASGAAARLMYMATFAITVLFSYVMDRVNYTFVCHFQQEYYYGSLPLSSTPLCSHLMCWKLHSMTDLPLPHMAECNYTIVYIHLYSCLRLIHFHS